MPSRVELKVSSLVCGRCGAANAAPGLRDRDGKCSCGSDTFTLALTARTSCSPDVADVANVALKQAAFGTLNPLSLSAMGDALSRYAVSEKTYELTDMPGSGVIELLALPPEDAVRWVAAYRKEQAKMNLQPHQALCLECGEIYAKSLAGPSAEGFCSHLCRNVHAKKTAPAPAAKGPRGELVKVTCPKCNRPVKIKVVESGGPYKCMWCGGPVVPPA